MEAALLNVRTEPLHAITVLKTVFQVTGPVNRVLGVQTKILSSETYILN